LIKQVQCLITALKAESVPLVQHYKLKRDNTFDFPFFINHGMNIALVGVGVGTKNIRSRVNGFFGSQEYDNVQFINIGIAGGNKRRTKIGQLFLINEVMDASSINKYYPDILTDYTLPEGSINSVKNPIVDDQNEYDFLVDMEAYELFKICSKLVPLHNIAILKLVSDYMDNHVNTLDHETISSLINKQITKISTFIERFKLIGEMKKPLLSKVDMDWIAKNKDKYYLTTAQVGLLVNLVKGYRINNTRESLPVIQAGQPSLKLDQKNTFRDICEKLKT
jgi:nucleoside phosphorylase